MSDISDDLDLFDQAHPIPLGSPTAADMSSPEQLVAQALAAANASNETVKALLEERERGSGGTVRLDPSRSP